MSVWHAKIPVYAVLMGSPDEPGIRMAMTNIARTVNMIIFILLLACCLFMDISSVA